MMALSTISSFSALLIFLLLDRISEGNVNSPCSNTNYSTIADVRRSTAYNKTVDLCDRNFIKDGVWYRFQSAAGNKMPETNPGNSRCGTYAPIWMNGKHPTNESVVKDVTACAVMPWLDEDCGKAYDIKVVNCGKFFLYQLKPPRQCSVAYCAGSKLQQGSCSSDGTSLPVCPGIVPYIQRVKISPNDGNEESVALNCSWNYNNNASIVQFQVHWFRDFLDSSHTIESTFNGTERSGYSSFFKKNTRSRTGYLWNKKAVCKVRARFHGGPWSRWKSSKRFYTGIAVHPKIIYMKDCEDDTKKEVFVSLTPHIPIRNNPYTFEIVSRGNDAEVGRICVRGKIPEDTGFCAVNLTSSHSIHSPLWIKVIASCNRKFRGKSPSNNGKAVQLSFGQNFYGKMNKNQFWLNYVFPTIQIHVATESKRYCWSTTDPNIYTFDRNYYRFMNAGTFRLYLNPYTKTEVQTRQIKCGWYHEGCNCGVAVKERLFYQIYDMCSRTNSHTPVFVTHTSKLPDSPKDGFHTNKTQSGSITTYNINLPSGIIVTVTRMPKFLNVHILAPVHYAGARDPKGRHSTGLCGNFNGVENDDFEGLTQMEFAESHRIISGSKQDIFGYRGNPVEEAKLEKLCNTESMCLCENGQFHACNTNKTINLCFPAESSTFAGDLCYGGRSLSKRRKRAAELADDDIDDQDEILPFNPPLYNYTIPTWPTPSGLTKDNVTNICSKRIKHSKAGEKCGTIAEVDLDSIMDQCVSDIQASDDIEWALSNFGVMEESCKKNIYKNISFFKNSTDGELELEPGILDFVCPNDCSDHGTCFNSTCTCFEDYTSADCSISLKDSPILYGIRKSGLCDVRRRPCRNVGIYAFPLLDSENLTCHVQEFKVIESAWKPRNTTSLYPGLIKDLAEVKCSLPESPVNFGDYGSKGVTAAGLKIAVSNNRINASKDFMLFISYDSVCQECNTTTGCTLKTNACLISGHCFAQYESHPDDWCQQCMPHISTTSWEKRRDNQQPKFTTSTVLYAFQGKQLRVQLRAIDPEYRTIRYSFAQNETFGASLTENGFFTWTKNTNDSTTFVFTVTDECGAYSVLNASVVIKECPCQNSGECHPDYRYLNGAGNFTCSCPAGYTGTLCELDVNECLVSKPCINGSCNNEQPGFSCSCYVGYTGDLCQTEINECVPNPCFLGVPCTDSIASFSCGPCPGGYSGDGVNCTRMDGKVDECVKKPQVCHSNAKCMYNNGSYVCQCTDGYTGDGKNNCTDVDECVQTSDICHRNANCTNTEGNYSCECLKGYTGDGKLNCSDIDECTSSNVCIQNAQCSNTVGSYACHCIVGYSGDGYNNCTDVDECVQTPDICHRNANCTNTEGNYSCECLKGYTGDGKLNCSDIDECTSSNVCIQNAQCSNTVGSYACHCIVGYSGDGYNNCTDINECQESPSVCHRLARCSNTEGLFSCQCDIGYTGDGIVNCTDVDECSQSPSVCQQHAKCTNTIGFYSCQCNQGFLGDGIQNCAENRPPQFTTPRTVYAILNNDSKIQIMAVDHENQDMTFTLLSNGTLTTARISKQLLTISNVKENGTVYVQVEDEMGAKNILILQVNAIECPCVHNGKCYQNKTILYPVQPSDYICECEDPYTGHRCEIRPNPCDELPCYPGLNCSTAQNSEGFTCEDCPTLFQGDGKWCDLNPNEEKSSVVFEMTLIDQKWDDQLKTNTSKMYKNLASQLTFEIKNFYKDRRTGFSYVIVNGFRRGSIIVELELIFTKEVENPLKPLMEVDEIGKLGKMRVKMKTMQDETKDDKILGLDKTIFFVIVGAAAVFILMIIVAIYIRIKRHRMHKVKIRAEILNKSDKKAQGIAFQPAGQASSEEIDLKVFDNEAIHLEEEIKLQH